ncbi:DUF1192 family protein [Brucellaceae bacterium C25G]
MSGFLEETIKNYHEFSIGDDLSDLSVSEIEQLIDRLRYEIDRLQQEYSQRGNSRAEAEALFR